MRFLKALRVLRRDDGFAVPAATLMLIAATGIVMVGVMSSVRTQSGTSRDQNTKSALPQAEAGAEQALLHFNRIIAAAGSCAPVTATAPDAAGWCGPVTGGFDGGNFSYYARPTPGQLEIVSTGTYGGVSRRVHVGAHSSSGQRVFFDATVKAQDGIKLNSEAQVTSNVATNGDINLDSNAWICGAARVGIGRELTKASNAQYFEDLNCTVSGTESEEELFLPPVNQGDAATVNDNGRLFELDPISGNKNGVCWNGFRGTGQAGTCGERELEITGNTSVTLGGAKYSFCKLSLGSNSALYVQSGSVAIIYFDSPEACGYGDNTTQLELASNSRISSTSGGPTNVAMLFVGSPTLRTVIHLNSNTSIQGACEQNLVLYAPRTDIIFNSNSTYCGAVAAKTIEMNSEVNVFMDSAARNFILPNTAAHYLVDRFVECTSTNAVSPPDAEC